MFVLSTKPTYRFKVVVHQPDEEKGTWKEFDFMGVFKRRSKPEVDAMFKGPEGNYRAPPDAEIIASELVGWEGVMQPDGAALEVNDGNRAVLLAQIGVQSAIVRAWLESSVVGPAKN